MIRIGIDSTGTNIPFRKIEDKKKKALERLSSGLKLNSASDDAAGLAISQAMKAQIRGLDKANQNVMDGISVIQTADGALSSVHSMLNRLVEISVQASNDIYTSQDRQKLQDEVNQLIEEIDNISENTNFNGIKLLDGSIGESEKQKFWQTVSIQNGITHKPPVNKGAVWEGSIDLSKIRDGVTLKINNSVFEFDTDGNLNTSGTAINITPTSSQSDIMDAIKTAVESGSLGGRLDTIDCNLSSGSNMEIKLKTLDTGVKNGETFTLSMNYSIPEVSTDKQTITPGVNVGPIGIGRGITISDIDLSTMVDGTTIDINGKIYEIDSDGVVASGHTTIAVADITNETSKANAITTELKKSFTGTIGFYKNGTTWEFRMKYKAYDTEDRQPLNIKFNSDIDKTMSVIETDSQKGVNTPEINFQPARRKDSIDFSRVSDGSIFIINGHKFEFDKDASSDTGNIAVDISAAKNASDIAQSFNAAFATSALGNDYTLSISSVDGDNRIIDISSIEAATSDGQQISMTFENVGNTDDVGLFLQIGSNDGTINKMCLKIDSTNSSYLDIANTDVSSSVKAVSSIAYIYNAIDMVSVNRANLGVAQNRLEFAKSSLKVTSDNLLAAESKISDADMAKEMMILIKENVLEQSAQGMLIKARNISVDTVQQLLQN